MNGEMIDARCQANNSDRVISVDFKYRESAESSRMHTRRFYLPSTQGNFTRLDCLTNFASLAGSAADGATRYRLGHYHGVVGGG